MSVELRRVAFPVTGMSCAACARRIEKALMRTEGVSAANVNLAVEKATVEYDPASAEPDALIRAVEDAGYGVEKLNAAAAMALSSVTVVSNALRLRRARID